MKDFKRAVLAVLSSIALTTGCSPFVDNNMIEEIAPVIFWYVADAGEGKLKISTVVPPLVREQKRLLTMQVDLLKQGGKDFNLIYYRELKVGQLRMVLINEEIAKKGLIRMVNTLLSDPAISPRLFLAIVQGNFDDYISAQLQKQPNLDYFLYRMFKHYEKTNQGEMTIVNLHDFLKRYYSPMPYPNLPVFKVSSNYFSYVGTAFFGRDKLKAIVQNMDDQIYQLINNDKYLKHLAIPALSTTLGQVRSSVQMKMNQDASSISVQVDLTGRIEEYQGDKNLLEGEQLADLRKEIESYLEKQTAELLKKMQRWKVDPLQMGSLSLGPLKKPLREKEWLNTWEHVKFDVDYRLHLQPSATALPVGR
ncbi:MAG: spore gernimation protein [Brevibacillus sp.]|nr:spore gernimation protein [Brevibacillus sp.]